MFVLVIWTGEPYEIGSLKNIGLGEVDFPEILLFTNGVAVGDLGTKNSGELTAARFPPRDFVMVLGVRVGSRSGGV